jgi:hypothetical protein
MDRAALATPNYRSLAGTLLLLPRQRPFALVFREPVAMRVAGVIQDHEMRLARRWTEPASDLLEMKGE